MPTSPPPCRRPVTARPPAALPPPSPAVRAPLSVLPVCSLLWPPQDLGPTDKPGPHGRLATDSQRLLSLQLHDHCAHACGDVVLTSRSPLTVLACCSRVVQWGQLIKQSAEETATRVDRCLIVDSARPAPKLTTHPPPAPCPHPGFSLLSSFESSSGPPSSCSLARPAAPPDPPPPPHLFFSRTTDKTLSPRCRRGSRPLLRDPGDENCRVSAAKFRLRPAEAR